MGLDCRRRSWVETRRIVVVGRNWMYRAPLPYLGEKEEKIETVWLCMESWWEHENTEHNDRTKAIPRNSHHPGPVAVAAKKKVLRKWRARSRHRRVCRTRLAVPAIVVPVYYYYCCCLSVGTPFFVFLRAFDEFP